jgi:hypothetical protein
VLLRYAADQPLDYAAGWNRPHRPHPERYGAALDRWLAYFDELGVETISWGALMLRRRAGRNWFFSHDSRVERITGAGAQVLRLFAAQDYLAELGDEDLLAARFSLAGEHRLDQTLRLDPEGTLVERSLLRLDSGLRLQVGIDVPTERVLSLLDGVRPLEAILEQVAASAPGQDGETFVADALPVMRRLVELGFVLPVSGATP